MFSQVLSIPAGQDTSEEVGFNRLRYAKSLGVFVESDGEPVTIEVSPVPNGDVWMSLQKDGADVSIGAGEALTIDHPAFCRLRLSTSEDAEDMFFCWIVVRD